MRKIFFLIIICALIIKAQAQPPVSGSYYTNTTMTSFHGTWIWINGTDTVKLYLNTKKVCMDTDSCYYRDMLTGWHIYKRGNTVIESSYNNINIIAGRTFLGSNTENAQNIVNGIIFDISKNKEAEVTLTLNAAQNQITWKSTEHQGMRIYGRPQDVPPTGLTLPRNMLLIKQ